MTLEEHLQNNPSQEGTLLEELQGQLEMLYKGTIGSGEIFFKVKGLLETSYIDSMKNAGMRIMTRKTIQRLILGSEARR